MGVDLIVLTGNPGNGVSNELIVEALKAILPPSVTACCWPPARCMHPV